MTKHVRKRTCTICILLGFLFLASPLLGQSPATQRLIELIRSGDSDVAEEKLPRAAIDAGPPAIPAIKAVLNGSPSEDQRDRALIATVYIGGVDALSLVREASEKGDPAAQETLPLVLASVDTPQNRAELIQMLRAGRGNNGVRRFAAVALGMLRATEAMSALRSMPRRSDDESEDVKAALEWIERGFWAIDTKDTSERQNVIAGVLRNGIPGLEESDDVVDELNGGVWRYTTSGWSFTKSEIKTGNTGDPTVNGFIGAEGSLALVSVKISCGRRCSSGYNFVLRHDAGSWKVQLFLMTWIT